MERVINRARRFIGISIFLCIWICTGNNIQAQELTGKEQAVEWVIQEASSEGEWENEGLPNLTCNVFYVLAKENRELKANYLTMWKEQQENLNNDELAHLAWATGDFGYMNDVWENQNEDGGFGLCKGYESNPYDTLLVLMAEVATSKPNEQQPEKVQKAMMYLVENQNEDGGFGYTEWDKSNPLLSAEVGIVVQTLQYEGDDFYSALDRYCNGIFTKKFSKTEFQEQAEIARYLYCRGLVNDSENIEKILRETQEENGSIYNSVEDTILYILLENEIDKYNELHFEISKMDVELNSYVWEADKTNEVKIHTKITYKTNQDINGVIRYTVIESGVDILTKEVEQLFSKEKTTTTIDYDDIMVEPSTEKDYVLRIEILVDGNVSDVVEIKLTIYKDVIDDLVLSADVVNGENYGLKLNWNDISNENHRYGYRVYRKNNDDEWETRSVWDGEEKVKVLNIYPCNRAKDYLVQWMETTLEESETPAGMGLFEIDTVYIDDYIKSPEIYLMDSNGMYKYDVLMFGTYDSNFEKDISSKAYEATQKFADAGGGILFGHDTILYRMHNFSKFADQIGILLKPYYNRRDTTKVRVVKQGFLTSYPWNLTGELTIPASHTQAQYTGGTLSADVWMEFDNEYDVDIETGGKTNAYLFTKNQLAMIQTGHSNGQATDDERKIIANTLFYLKQYTYATSATDHSFYDENAPENITVSDMVNGQIIISADDKGTPYDYYVEAVGEKRDENIKSNIVEATAISGLKGFVVKWMDSNEPADILTYDEEGNLTSEILPATEGSLIYKLDNIDVGESGYLHIFAVDYAGNISKEQIIEVTNASQISDKEYLNLPYAMVATEEEVSICCSMANIKGDIYGEREFFFQGSTLELSGTARTPGKLSIAGGVLHLTGQEEGITPIKLPDYTDTIVNDIAMEQAPVDEIMVYNSTEINSPVFCQRTTGAWCNDLSLHASLISNQDISFNANTITCTGENPVILCSKEGNIRVQATKFGGSGLIYAPNGTVTICVSEFNYTGSIIAKKIVFQSGNVNVNR